MTLTVHRIAEVRARTSALGRAGLAAACGAGAFAAALLPQCGAPAVLLAGGAALFGGRLAGLITAFAAGVAAYLAFPPLGSRAAIVASVVTALGCALLAWLTGAPAAGDRDADPFALPLGDRLALPPATLERGLGALTTGVRDVAAGDLTKNLAVADGPLGELAIGLNKLIYGMRDFVGTLHREAGKLGAAGGDLRDTAGSSVAVIEGGSIAQKQLEEGIVEQNHIVDGAAGKVRALRESIDAIAGAAEEQTRSLDETAMNVTSMSASIEEVAAQVDSLLTISSETTLTADRGGTAIHTIVDAMGTVRTTIEELAADVRRLGDNSAQIGEIVKVIDRIAEQTNLLALNAAIEAARAGEHGRGFAVVASEIRKLADGSVQATKEIASHIGSTQGVIAQVTDAMGRLDERLTMSVQSTDNASDALREIVDAVLTANQQIGQIATVTRSMSDHSVAVIRSIEEITRSVALNLEATRQMAGHSTEVSSAFESIASISSQNASSVEVLSYVNAEVTSAAQRILVSVEDVNARAAAIDAQLGRYLVTDTVAAEGAPV